MVLVSRERLICPFCIRWLKYQTVSTTGDGRSQITKHRRWWRRLCICGMTLALRSNDAAWLPVAASKKGRPPVTRQSTMAGAPVVFREPPAKAATSGLEERQAIAPVTPA